MLAMYVSASLYLFSPSQLLFLLFPPSSLCLFRVTVSVWFLLAYPPGAFLSVSFGAFAKIKTFLSLQKRWCQQQSNNPFFFFKPSYIITKIYLKGLLNDWVKVFNSTRKGQVRKVAFALGNIGGEAGEESIPGKQST